MESSFTVYKIATVEGLSGEIVVRDGNCSFLKFGVLLEEEGQYSVLI